MKELKFLEIINETLDDNSYLGDDCAFIKESDLFVTHDTLVENVHFTMYTTSPYLLAKKSVAVNLSDLASALAQPKYITISISLPSQTDENFIREFYKGINDAAREYNIKVIGGDITGSEKIVISVCAIGKRNKAKKGDLVYTTGFHGSSSAGFYALSNFLYADDELINSHLNPAARLKESLKLAEVTDGNIAIMDSSDGLIDSLYKLAQSSKHSVEVDINNVPVSKSLIEFSKQNDLDYKKFVKWGGEDFELIFCIPPELADNLDKNLFTQIGKVLNKDAEPSVIIKDGNNTEKINYKTFSQNTYNHFGNNI